MNNFLKLALTGFSITAVIHILLYFVLKTAPEFNYMTTFYIVWLGFGIIGLGNSKSTASKVK